MDNFKKFLVPIDGSAASERAAQKAAEFAKATGAHLHLLYAAELKNGPIPQHFIEKKDLPEDVIKALTETGNEILQRIYNKLPKEIQEKTSCQVEVDIPKKIILSVSRQLPADLIIMGTRGLNPAQAIIVGSVSQTMIEHANCPVMMVR
ncbi:universal stress protein [Pectinatus sottacetonis]|uniref:universal stress protein n=1 Tax=Pectinatus sottacetonis TaxID=1002795 RepID=UPI0018C4B004|nr:universal stress protein [Pectinatus sottacetonis]